MNDERGFDEPWQAQALALAFALQDAGVITAGEWAEALGRERAVHGLKDDGSDYYDSVVAALEQLIEGRGLSTKAAMEDVAAAWRRAAHATPHGMPIALENDPQRRRA
ncbi:MAG: nitrile hydratase accessory protein [Rhizobiaceae bacterium]|nr:nitrile hydratase accessory protein [Rhizobiaceae bacterium]